MADRYCAPGRRAAAREINEISTPHHRLKKSILAAVVLWIRKIPMRGQFYGGVQSSLSRVAFGRTMSLPEMLKRLRC